MQREPDGTLVTRSGRHVGKIGGIGGLLIGLAAIAALFAFFLPLFIGLVLAGVGVACLAGLSRAVLPRRIEPKTVDRPERPAAAFPGEPEQGKIVDAEFRMLDEDEEPRRGR